MRRHPTFGFALLALATLSWIAVAAAVQPVAATHDSGLSDRMPEHIARLFGGGLVSLDNLGL